MSDLLNKCLSPVKLNGLTLRNRIIRAGTFEGMTPGGIPSERLIRLHTDAAKGGTGLTTVAYCAAEADGRVMEEMMYMHEGIRPQLERLAASVHAEGGALSGQLGHCGHFTQNREFQGKRPLGPSPHFNLSGIPYGTWWAGAMGTEDMNKLVQTFYDAAKFMKSVGFDAIEIHFAHGYGLSQFISPKTNKRTDEYGGTIENRMRLPLRVLEAVRKAVGEDFPILGKMGLTDGVKGGLEIDDAVKVAAMLDKGGIDCLIPSGGTSSMNPMLLFRGDNIWGPLLRVERNPILWLGIFFMRPFMFHNYPYHEMYFLDGARRVRDTVKNAKVCYIGGVSTVDSMEKAIKEFDFIEMGRALIADPALVNHVTSNSSYSNPCNHCNKCAALIGTAEGIRCVEVHPNPLPEPV
jgi:2,4-dienoyl-CoA reductase-like NADH-dependent reductase (Old Yellow Enzyme family)